MKEHKRIRGKRMIQLFHENSNAIYTSITLLEHVFIVMSYSTFVFFIALYVPIVMEKKDQ